MTNLSSSSEDLWSRLEDVIYDADQFRKIFLEFKNDNSLWQKILKEGLHSKNFKLAISTLKYLSDQELQKYFDELVKFSYSQGLAKYCRELILRLPRDWVLENIESATRPILENEPEKSRYDSYRRLLELYILLDKELTRKLAEEAFADSDHDVREAGADFLEKLGDK